MTLVAGTQTARADDSPTSIQLLDQCGSADYCVFHPQGTPSESWTPSRLVSQTANCTGRNQSANISWTSTTFSSNSIGASLKVIVGAAKAFMLGFKIAYSHEWTDTKTSSSTTAISIPELSMGHIYYATQMETVTGTFELHFGHRYDGHYYWYVPYTETSPTSDGKNTIVTASSRLTPAEHAAYC